jgi:hypothetical protein
LNFNNKKLLDSHRFSKFENFCEDLVEECMKYGEIEEVLTYSNMGDHMIGKSFFFSPRVLGLQQSSDKQSEANFILFSKVTVGKALLDCSTKELPF